MSKVKHILVVNDDGISAEGIVRLARAAQAFGHVTVVAPASQCSAMSHRLSVAGTLHVQREDFPVEGCDAWSVTGTPADCVKIALQEIMTERPDVLFSGINAGYNIGLDILYSGTMGAAMEGLRNGVPAIAFSLAEHGRWDCVDAYIESIAERLMDRPAGEDAVWNVNFPGVTMDEFQGIAWDVIPASRQYYHDCYLRENHADGSFTLTPNGTPIVEGEAGTDIGAVLQAKIAVGKVRSSVILERPMDLDD